jgi:hypothetical protein
MLTQLIATYGYWAVGTIVALEGVGLTYTPPIRAYSCRRDTGTA